MTRTLPLRDRPILPDSSYPAPHIHRSPFASTAAPYFSANARSLSGVAPSWASGEGFLTCPLVLSSDNTRYLLLPHPSGAYGDNGDEGITLRAAEAEAPGRASSFRAGEVAECMA
jgi:hypothetical protein